MRKDRIPLNLPLVVTVFSWGFNFLSLKILYRDVPPYAVMFDRSIVMGICLFALCLIRKQSLRYPGGTDTLRVLLSGFIAFGLYMVFFLRGLELTSPAETAIMLATAPVFTFVLSTIARQEPFTWSALCGSTLAFAGVATVIIGGASGGHGSLVGDSIVLVSAFVWATGVVVLRPVLSRHDPMRMFTLSIPGAIPVLLLFGLLPACHVNYGTISLVGWANFGQVCLLSGVIGFGCFYLGVHQIGAARATMYQFFVPIIATFFQWVFFRQALNDVQLVGLAILLMGVLYTSRARAAARKFATEESPQ